MLRRPAAYTLLYTVAIAVGRLTAQQETGLSLFWPAAGVGVLWALRCRGRRDLALAVGLTAVLSGVGNAVTDVPAISALALGVANGLLGLITWALFSRHPDAVDRRMAVRRLAHLNRLVWSAAVASALTAGVAMAGLVLGGTEVTWGVATGWWLRNMAAIVVVAGPALTMNRRAWVVAPKVLLEAVLIAGLTVVVVWSVFGPGQALPLAFVPLAFIVWAGVRLPLPYAAAEGALIAVSALVMVLAGDGGPVGAIQEPAVRALVLQAYMVLAALLAVVLATFRAELGDLVTGIRREHDWSRQLVADAPTGVAVLDPHGVVLEANRALAEILECTEADLIGSNAERLTRHDPGAAVGYLRDVLTAAGGLVQGEWVVRTSAGASRSVTTTGRWLVGTGGEPRVLVHVVDVTERRLFEERLAHLATHDVLTGLPNRRGFDELLAGHLERCAAQGASGALLLLDLDNFKDVNDSLGHAAGDDLIRTTATLLAGVVGPGDSVVRLGGDEFALLLAHADVAEAEVVARAAGAVVRGHGAAVGGVHQHVTASIGVVTFAVAATRDVDVLALADLMMYAAKDAGRDGHAVLGSTGAEPLTERSDAVPAEGRHGIRVSAAVAEVC